MLCDIDQLLPSENELTLLDRLLSNNVETGQSATTIVNSRKRKHKSKDSKHKNDKRNKFIAKQLADQSVGGVLSTLVRTGDATMAQAAPQLQPADIVTHLASTREMGIEYEHHQQAAREHADAKKTTLATKPTASIANIDPVVAQHINNAIALNVATVPSDSDSDEDVQASMATANYTDVAKQQNKKFKRTRCLVSHKQALDDVLSKDPDGVVVGSLNDQIVGANSEAVVIQTAPPTPLAIQEQPPSPPAQPPTALYKLDTAEQARLERYKTFQQSNILESMGSQLRNIDFKLNDMSWLIDRVLHEGGVRAWIPESRIEYINKARAACVTVTRREEDEYLRVPLGPHERPCVFGDSCEGCRGGFELRVTLVEFLDINDRNQMALNNNSLPPVVRPCVMCRRFLVQYANANLRNENKTSHLAVNINYKNKHDVAGEYSSSQMINTSVDQDQAVMAFVVRHVRRYYRQYTDEHGVVRFEQTGYLQVPADVSNGTTGERSFFL